MIHSSNIINLKAYCFIALKRLYSYIIPDLIILIAFQDTFQIAYFCAYYISIFIFWIEGKNTFLVETALSVYSL